MFPNLRAGLNGYATRQTLSGALCRHSVTSIIQQAPEAIGVAYLIKIKQGGGTILVVIFLGIRVEP